MDRPAVFSPKSFGELDAAARTTDEVLIADFTATWCAPCQAMERTTWRDGRVVQWVMDHGRAVQVDIDQDRATAERFGVRSVPTVIALRRGQEVDRFTGARPPEPMLQWLAGVLKGETEVDRLRARAKDGGIEVRYELARSLASAGRFDDAAQEYLWLWSHGAEVEPEFTGVRYSYLAAELGELARAHPPTREALKKLRDEAGAQVDAGKLALLDDWFALNLAIGEVGRSVEWFDRAAKEPPPGLDFARLQRWLAEALKERGRWADLAKLYPDPLGAIDQHQHIVTEMLSEAGPATDPAMREMAAQMRDYAEASLRELAQDLVHALGAAGRADEAGKVAARARELDPSPKMAQALAEVGAKA